MKNKDAFKLFFIKENKQLLGHKYISLWVTCGIFLLAILSTGFSVASLRYLESKMSDPFVTCIDIPVSQFRIKEGYNYQKLKRFIDKNENILGYSGSEPVHRLYDGFIDIDGKNRQLDGRTLAMNSPLKNTTILSKDNVIFQRQDTITDSDFGIILSIEGLEHLKMKGKRPAILKRFIKKNYQNAYFGVPVLAIVKQLPNMCDFIATDAYAQHEIANVSDHFNISERDYNKFMQLVIADNAADDICTMFQNNPNVSSVDKVPYFGSWSNDYQLITIHSSLDSCKEQFFDSLYMNIANDSIYRLYPFNYEAENKQYHDPALISCYFKQDSLQFNVQKFSNILDSETGYKIDLSKIENLKNLDRVQLMGRTLSIIIIFIVIIFIGFFIYFLLNTHFQKIQRNIGTFKAFGVSDYMIYGIYGLIIICMITIAYAISFGTSAIVSEIINWLCPLTDEKGHYNRLDYLVWQNGIIFVLSLLLSVITTVAVANKLLRHTPGNLIYNRTK